MTRNLRTQVVDLAEHALRSWHGDDITREDAERYLPGWRFFGGLDDDLRREVLSRFSPAEPPSVPGVDYLPEVLDELKAGADTLVVETVAAFDDLAKSVAEPVCTSPLSGVINSTSCLLAPMHAGLCEPPVPTHPNAEGADAEVQP
ncbi:MAG: hypothetical protein HOV94_34540 [Saccharothrix sp.]|nr:hypothetical protein [Saccharothrix sp.]